MTYNIERLNRIAKNHPDMAKALYEDSRAAVTDALAQKPVKCSQCAGHKQMASFSSMGSSPQHVFTCPTCNGVGEVVRPVFGVEDLNGGWGQCPYCFEGMESNEKPCDICEYWIDKLDGNNELPAHKTSNIQSVGALFYD